MIIVLGRVSVDPSEVDAFRKDIDAIDPVKNGMDGCLFYSVTPDSLVPGNMIVAERWRDQRSLTGHLQRTETVSFGLNWAGRMRPDVRKYDAYNERGLLD